MPGLQEPLAEPQRIPPWPRWRRRFPEHSRSLVMVSAKGSYGILQIVEYSLLLGVPIKDRPPSLLHGSKSWPNTRSLPMTELTLLVWPASWTPWRRGPIRSPAATRPRRRACRWPPSLRPVRGRWPRYWVRCRPPAQSTTTSHHSLSGSASTRPKSARLPVAVQVTSPSSSVICPPASSGSTW